MKRESAAETALNRQVRAIQAEIDRYEAEREGLKQKVEALRKVKSNTEAEVSRLVAARAKASAQRKPS